MDGDANSKGEGDLALLEIAVTDGVGAVGGDPELRVEPVEGLLEGQVGVVDEGLELSLAVRSTRNVGLYLPAFAQLALVEGDAERAALLVGAAEGLRQRVGLRAWPMLRPGEAELVAQIREALGADRFEELFAAGARLNRREAVAALRDRGGAGASTMVVMQPGDAAAARR